MSLESRNDYHVQGQGVAMGGEVGQLMRSGRQIEARPSRSTRCRADEAMARCCVAGAVLVCAGAVAFAQSPFQTDADSAHAKLTLIDEAGERPRDQDLQPVRTSIADRELNAYLKVYGPTFLPQGLADPQVVIGDHGRVRASGFVDLDAVRLSRQRDWLDPMAYLTGLLPFTATGIVTGSNGTGVASFESATLADVSVPKSVIQELVRYYTTTPDTPNGLAFDEPVELPAKIQSLLFESGRVTVIQ
jgi:hypothetical protein